MGRAFTRVEAGKHGVTPRMLQHARFTEVFPSIYRATATTLDGPGLIDAGRLCLPGDARVSHLTRLRLLGLEYGPLLPLHFTVGRDLHLAIDDIYLHRTVTMPLHDTIGVAIEAAFVGAACTLRLIDLIKIGDWLVSRGHLDPIRLATCAAAEPWRPGAARVMKAVPHLDGRSSSLKESETRAVLVFAGLPMPDVNRDIYDGETFLGCGDLVYRLWKLVIEYEGRQHAFDAAQFDRDIHRYAGFRSGDWEYVQVTNAKLARPRALVLDVHRVLKSRGYDGPPPSFGSHWHSLFARPGL
jgi:hypothetical protein